MKQRKRPGAQPRDRPRFRVVVAKQVDVLVRGARTPRSVRRAFVQVHRDTAAHGCAAAHYRLSGPGSWPRFCIVRLPESWRLVLSFPDTDTVVLLRLQRHDNRTDPYAFLEAAFGLPDRTGHGAGITQPKPSCCDDHGEPPLAQEADLVAAIDEIVTWSR